MASHLNLLLIEDNPDDVFLLQETLKSSGISHSMNVLTDGEEAFDFVQELSKYPQHKLPQVIILDINLPKKSGHDILREIKKYPSLDDVQVVLLSTSDSPKDKLFALEHNAIYVTKPASVENLFSVLETFELAFVELEREEHIAAVSHSAPPVGPVDCRILYVEDNPSDFVFLEETLKAAKLPSYHLTRVDNLEAALEKLQDENFNLILSDLGLPDAQGVFVVSQLLEVASQLPLIVLTGNDDEATAEQAVSSGAQDYLVKGQFDSQTLSRSIKYALTRKRAEELAIQSVVMESTILQQVLEHSPISMAKFDSDLYITACNSVFANHFGMDIDQVKGLMISELIELPRPRLWLEAIAHGTPFRMDRFCLSSNPDLADAYWNLTVWPVKTREMTCKGGLFLAIDVTAQVKLEMQREDFMAALAHDMKNPLLGADRILGLMLQDSFDKTRNTEMIALLKDSNSSVLTMLRDLLDIFRYESDAVNHDFAQISVLQPINSAVSTMALAAMDKNIKVIVDVPPDLSEIMADSVTIQRVFGNLLHNALNFSNHDASVTIKGREEEDFIVIDVIDTGSGIGEKELATLFSRFGETASSRYRSSAGTGLGLYLCKQIVEANGGTINCQSTVGQGSVFTVRLPVARKTSGIASVN